MNILAFASFISIFFSITYGQQCTSFSYERCLCITSTPYCTCSALTSTNTLNFSSSYNSHLVAVASQGCRPCSSNCLRCSSLTVCTQCISSFELVSGQCQACPANCQTCSNGVCATCITGYYLDYQTNCQTCPIIGTAVCTISSLQSCLSNYWLDNNAANCIACDINCYQCSSTTKCSICNQGYYLLSNYTCSSCQLHCLSCSDANSCIVCANQTQYFNISLGICLGGSINNCLISSSSSKCSQCLPGYYLNSSSFICVQVASNQLIANCQIFGYNNGTIFCKNCSLGYFNLTNGCYYTCSNLCTSCYGPHYGLCYGCIANAYLVNFHCIPTFNLMQGASYQLFYTAYNNPTFFSGSLISSGGCLLEPMASSTSGQLSITLSSLQSYQITLKWKIYIYSLPNNQQSIPYDVIFNNSQWSFGLNFNASYCISNCNASTSVCVDKASFDIANIILNTNKLTFSISNASVGVSEVLVIAKRCGGIQGGACLQCSSTSTCTMCVNPNYYISGYTCVISCPASYYVRTATKTCLSQCVSGTYADNIQLLCVQCQSPCLTCTSDKTCLTCVQDTFLYQQNCLSSCPNGYFANNMRRTCDICIRPCLTCISNLQCLSCIYGFYNNITHSCVLKCTAGYYGKLQTVQCQKCVSPCLTCNSNIGSRCQSCINGTYLYSSECLQNCPQGYYEAQNICSLCDITCSACSKSSINCTSCPIGSYLSNFTCISNCPLHFFADSTTGFCHSCPDNCSTCINAQYCETCLSNFVFYSSNYICIDSCPQFYYADSVVCYNCQTPCFQCVSATQCLSCQGLFLSNYTCLSVCPSGWYGNTQKMQCLACNLTVCKECFLLSTFCTSCNNKLILFNNECLEACPQSYYLQLTNYICLNCKENCKNCANLSTCLVCQNRYILQNDNCIKVCDIGYYSTIINETAFCFACPSSCTSCKISKNHVSCISCVSGYFSYNTTCQSTCGSGYFGYNGQCYVCISPCLDCSSQTYCLSCRPDTGFLFNNSCLNSCPLGYYENQTNQCQKCSSNCLNCIGSASSCISCNRGLYLLQKSCISSCLSGYYSIYSSNICYKCSSICSTCINSPTNCTSCSKNNTVLSSGSCLLSCPLGTYKLNKTCNNCPINCSQCINSSYCTSCSTDYYLTPSVICSGTCPSKYFPLNGICRPCSYPCATCLSYQVCLTCLSGYLSSGSCVSTCSAPTFLNIQAQSCEACPSNCSNCINFNQCLECLQGVLVNGSCLSQCPQGYYNYYSICAPCMYGCLNCNDSSTCTLCYIGYLYNGVCLQFCPVGWVSPTNSSQPICTQCIQGCLKCTVQANQCTLCANGLFLYIYTCLSYCPSGTYKNYKSSECVTCQSPCETCNNGYSCETCIYGYLLYTEHSGNQCIQGPACPNSFYLNVANNTCVYQCPVGTYMDPYGYTCSHPCSQTYVLLKPNMTCLKYCPAEMWINSNLICEEGIPPVNLPYFKCESLIMRNILVIQCFFSIPIDNLETLTVKDIQISFTTPVEIIFINSQDIRIVTNTPIGVFRQSYFTLSLKNRYQLYSTMSAPNTTKLNDLQRRLDQIYALPVQNTNTTFLLKTYFSYSDQQRQTGMQLMQIAQSICIGAFIFWTFALLKNLKSTSLTFICILQWIYSLSLVDTTFAPNLGLFLEGFKVSNFFFGYASDSLTRYLWMINSSYRETLWGIVNLFDFQTVFLPSIVIIFVFGFIYLITLAIHKKYQQNPLLSKVKEQTDKKSTLKNSSLRSNLQRPTSQKKKQKEDDEYQKQQISIFSNQVSGLSLGKPRKISKNILDINQSQNFSIQKLSFAKRSQQSSKGLANSSKSIKKIPPQQQKPVQNDVQSNPQHSWEMKKYKLGLKCKIIHDRFYFNYWLQCTLLTASPLSIAVCCQIIAATPLSLIVSILFALFSFILIWNFVKKGLAQQKLFVTTKYWFILYIETMLQNGMAILSTTQIYIGIMMLMLVINIYVWNRIFSSKRSNQLKHFYQINDALRIVLLLEALIGYTNAKKWDSDTYYYYSWVFIVTLIALIVFGAIHNTKQFFDREEGAKQEQAKMKQTNVGNQSESESSILKSRFTSNIQAQEDQESQQIKNEAQFFSQHEGEDTDSDNDIIDFDEVDGISEKRAPKQLIRYEKNDDSS